MTYSRADESCRTPLFLQQSPCFRLMLKSRSITGCCWDSSCLAGTAEQEAALPLCLTLGGLAAALPAPEMIGNWACFVTTGNDCLEILPLPAYGMATAISSLS